MIELGGWGRIGALAGCVTALGIMASSGPYLFSGMPWPMAALLGILNGCVWVVALLGVVVGGLRVVGALGEWISEGFTVDQIRTKRIERQGGAISCVDATRISGEEKPE